MSESNVYQAVAAVAAAMPAISKDRKSEQRYKYRGIDDLYNAIHKPLADAGVLIVPTVLDHQMIGVTINEKPWVKHVVRVRYTVYGPAGDSFAGEVVAEGLDNSDKGTGKALSYAYKSFAHQLFAVPTDDPGMDNEHASPVVDHVQPAPAEPVDLRAVLTDRVAKLDPVLRAVFDHKSAVKGWKTVDEIPDARLGSGLKTVDGLVVDGPVTADQLKRLGILGTRMGWSDDEIHDIVGDHTDGRTRTRKGLLRSEADALIGDWAALTPPASDES